MSALKYLTGYPPLLDQARKLMDQGRLGRCAPVIRKARMACAPTASCMTTWST